MTTTTSVGPAVPPAIVAFRGVGKSFRGGVRALQDVSFTVAPGEFCVLLGRSGAGKSTLLRAVNGLTALTQGRVAFDGVPITRTNQRAVQQRTAMIHQQFSLVQRLSVASNVMSGALAVVPLWRVALRWYPPTMRAKCWSLMQRMGLSDAQLFRRAQDLSGGQQQRVGIARAFMLDPDLILADEPVASLDPTASRDVLTLLHDAARERNTAVLCSLHQLDLAREYADRIVGMRDGRVVFDGQPGALSSEVVEEIYGKDTEMPSLPREPGDVTPLPHLGQLEAVS